jgi:hypothetical protein
MKSNEEIRKEWYDLLFEYPQLKSMSDVEKEELIRYFDKIDVTAHRVKQHIFDKLETIICDLVWPHDDIMQVYLLTGILQETAVAIWILNEKKLPNIEWLIDTYLDYWTEDPKRMCEPLFTDGSQGKNFHEAIGYAGNRTVNKIALHVISEMNSITLTIDGKPQKVLAGVMSYMIGDYKILRENYWCMTDAERQALHDQHNSGSKAIPFDPRFAEKYGKNPNGPF